MLTPQLRTNALEPSEPRPKPGRSGRRPRVPIEHRQLHGGVGEFQGGMLRVEVAEGLTQLAQGLDGSRLHTV